MDESLFWAFIGLIDRKNHLASAIPQAHTVEYLWVQQ